MSLRDLTLLCMMMKYLSFLLSIGLLLSTPLEAKYILRQGRLQNEKSVVSKAVEEHFNDGLQAIREERWREARLEFQPIVANYLASPYGKDSLFYLGVALFHMKEYDVANKRFTEYLEDQRDLKFFEDAVRYQLAIAEAYHNGAKRHLFGKESLPKWGPAKKDALRIYDEVVASMPSGDPAAEALYAKGHLLLERREFRQAVEAFAQITQHFPKHELAPKAYLAIGKTFHRQASLEHQNPDLLSLAEINLQRLRAALPSHEGVSEAERDLIEMKEFYAEGLWDTGQFYERIKKSRAAAMYYFCAVRKFPETEVAQKCRNRLKELETAMDELELSMEHVL